MAIKFIGQFLVERGHLTVDQLLDALNEQDDARLGALAVAKGILLEPELESILDAQQREDARLGEIAIKRRLMSQDQLQYLLDLQKNDRRMLGQVLVRKGHMTQAALDGALKEFDGVQSELKHVDPQYLPPEHGGRKDMVAMAGMTCKMLLRMAHLPVKMDEATLYEGSATPHGYSVEVDFSGDYGDGRYLLSCDNGLARAIEQRMSGALADQGADEELLDALGEFCNLVVGASTSALAALGHQVTVTPPRAIPAGTNARPVRSGVRWDIHTPAGRATVLMQ